jgi:ABC-type multidrug transport system fused ATPase/permease subunit
VLVIEESAETIYDSTSESIMEIVKREFADSTLLIIASDLKSTRYRDMPVLLLENSRVKNFDLPHKLNSDLPSTSTS